MHENKQVEIKTPRSADCTLISLIGVLSCAVLFPFVAGCDEQQAERVNPKHFSVAEAKEATNLLVLNFDSAFCRKFAINKRNISLLKIQPGDSSRIVDTSHFWFEDSVAGQTIYLLVADSCIPHVTSIFYKGKILDSLYPSILPELLR